MQNNSARGREAAQIRRLEVRHDDCAAVAREVVAVAADWEPTHRQVHSRPLSHRHIGYIIYDIAIRHDILSYNMMHLACI